MGKLAVNIEHLGSNYIVGIENLQPFPTCCGAMIGYHVYVKGGWGASFHGTSNEHKAIRAELYNKFLIALMNDQDPKTKKPIDNNIYGASWVRDPVTRADKKIIIRKTGLILFTDTSAGGYSDFPTREFCEHFDMEVSTPVVNPNGGSFITSWTWNIPSPELERKLYSKNFSYKPAVQSWIAQNEPPIDVPLIDVA